MECRLTGVQKSVGRMNYLVNDKYERVHREYGADQEVKENEVRVTTKTRVRNSIDYAMKLFEVRRGMWCHVGLDFMS